MRLTAVSSGLVGVAALIVLAWYGGAGSHARSVFAAAVAAALLLAGIGMGRRYRVPSLGWIALALGPAALLATLQALPLPWTHPWAADDLQALGLAASAWSIDPEATARAALWALVIGGAALVWQCHFRGERARTLAWALVAVACAHAAFAIVMALCAAPWPSEISTFRARGCFVYYNHAAAFSACCLPLAILLAREHGGPWLWMAIGVLVLAVVLSSSRGGILVAAAINLPLAWRVLPRRRRVWWFALLVGGIAGYLAIIGLQDIGAKFGRLMGPEGITLNGRVTIWQSSLPLIADAGALGSGANTAEQAWWRTGDASFTGRVVNHLHSDPLEWLLEFGWAGAAAVAAGLALAAWLARPERGADGRRRPADAALYWGGALGLATLAGHSLGEFIWNREAIAIAAVILAVLVHEARADHREREPRRTTTVRVVCLLAAVAIAAALPHAWRADDERAQALEASRWVKARKQAGLPLSGDAFERLLQARPHGARLAVEQARAALDAAPGPRRAELLATARHALSIAAAAKPADGGAWVERARLAGLEPGVDRTLLATAITRVMTWTRSWPYAQVRVLDAVRRGSVDVLGPERRRELITSLLALDQAQPAWFFALAERTIGAAPLAAHLSDAAGDRLARSGLRWLARHGDAPGWERRWRALAPASVALAPGAAPLAPLLEGPAPEGTVSAAPDEPATRSIRVRLPGDPDARRWLAEELDTAGLPLPPALSEALRGHGPPWNLWAEAIDPESTERLDAITAGLERDLFRPWARHWFDRANQAKAALRGSTLRVTMETDPRVVARAVEASVSAGERARLGQLLAARSRPQWRKLDGARWTWLAVGARPRALGKLTTWTGLVVDGRWIGWRRGTLTTAGIEPGLRRVVLVYPPSW